MPFKSLRFIEIIILSCVALFVAGSLSAADSGMYIGASVGKASFEYKDFEEDFQDNFKGDDNGYKIFLGYRFGNFVAAEAGYVDLGSISDTVEDIDIEVQTKAWDAFALGILPLGPVDIFAKAGVISWNADYKAAIDDFTGGSESGTDMAYGVGVALNLGALAVRVEYERFDIADTEEVFMFTGGITWLF